ncbi:type 1 glutamine amidotransferase domain-containing protein [Stenotrophomonas sp. MMGLT7]|uniref:type 1 glutamine amidotransferase domain-containing protein n=1 Tax=Stenotrophomonas sp. MMGLT7 TaxID=2901227 RepID=UPI001E39685B|nr:type 1 glutamine amidotransferase domain-containing protein [Stenotrophomonas sp. MMGLT7]MCD7099339.1 type 1 glutamine amidotransferase [Stenotrophomonas sp. MMGLT7]
MSHALSGKHVAILATDGFEQSELTEPKRLLESWGATVDVVSPKKQGEGIRGWKHTDWGDTVAVDVALADADPAGYDALVLPGGVINPDALRIDAKAVDFIKAFAAAGKPVAAICHGPWLLVESGLAKGRQVTSWPSLKTDLVNAGAQWKDAEVVVDGKLVTSRKPDDIPAFADAVARALQA